MFSLLRGSQNGLTCLSLSSGVRGLVWQRGWTFLMFHEVSLVLGRGVVMDDRLYFRIRKERPSTTGNIPTQAMLSR